MEEKGREGRAPNNGSEGRILIVLYLMMDGVIDLRTCTCTTNMR